MFDALLAFLTHEIAAGNNFRCFTSQSFSYIVLLSLNLTFLMLDILCQNTIRFQNLTPRIQRYTPNNRFFFNPDQVYLNENILIGMGWSWIRYLGIFRRHKHGSTDITLYLRLTQWLDWSYFTNPNPNHIITGTFIRTSGGHLIDRCKNEQNVSCLLLSWLPVTRKEDVELNVAYPLASRPVATFYQNFLPEYYVDWQI